MADQTKQILVRRRFVKVAPDKVRKAAALVCKKNAHLALAILRNMRLVGAKPLGLAIKSAMAIAREKDIAEKNIQIFQIAVDEGPKLKRRRIIQQGRATAILKRMSHITVVLADNGRQMAEGGRRKDNRNIENGNPKIKNRGMKNE